MKFEKLSGKFNDLSRAKMIVARICMHGCQTTQGYVFRTGLGHVKSQQIPQEFNRTYCIQLSFQPSHVTKAMVFHLWIMEEYNRPTNYTNADNVHVVRHLLACMVNTLLTQTKNTKTPGKQAIQRLGFPITFCATPFLIRKKGDRFKHIWPTFGSSGFLHRFRLGLWHVSRHGQRGPTKHRCARNWFNG